MEEVLLIFALWVALGFAVGPAVGRFIALHAGQPDLGDEP